MPPRRRFAVLCRGGRGRVGIPPSNGIYLSRSEARKYAVLLKWNWHLLTDLGISLLDILLHQSGHIMLSDFDLAKQSNESGGMPTMVQSEHNGVSGWNSRRLVHVFIFFEQDSNGGHDDVHGQPPDKLFRWNRRFEVTQLIGNLICWIWTHFRVHCAGGYRCTRPHGGSGLVDLGHPYLWNDSTCLEKVYSWGEDVDVQYFFLRSPLNSSMPRPLLKELNVTIHLIISATRRYNSATVQECHREWREWCAGMKTPRINLFLFNKEIRLANVDNKF